MLIDISTLRIGTYLGLLGLLLLLLILIAGRRSIYLFCAISSTLGIIWFGILPLINIGFNPLWISLAGSILIAGLAILFITRFKRNTFFASLAAFIGIVISFYLATYANSRLHLTGYSEGGLGEWLIKSGFSQNPVAVSEVIVAGLFMGAIGALIDLTISIISGMGLIIKDNPNLPVDNLVQSGLRIGRDIAGVSVITLLFAYLGSNIFLLLAPFLRFIEGFGGWDKPFIQIINSEEFSTEAGRALISILGIMLTMPIAVVSVAFVAGKKGVARALMRGILAGKRVYFVIISIVLIVAGGLLIDRLIQKTYYPHTPNLQVVRAEVIDKGDIHPDPLTGVALQPTRYKIVSGDCKGRHLLMENFFGRSFDWVDPVVGENQILTLHHEGSQPLYGSVRYFERDRFLFRTLIIAFIFIAVVGGISGLRTICMLVLSGGVIFGIYLPLVAKGANGVSLFFGLLPLLATGGLLIIGGFNIKALGAAVATICTFAITALIVSQAVVTSSLTGMGIDIRYIMRHFSSGEVVDFQGLLISGMMLGALGAIMDIAISISSGMREALLNNPDMPVKRLITAGMEIGRNVVGVTIITLLLAYAGVEFSSLLLRFRPGVFTKPLTYYYYAEVIIRMLTGAIAIVLACPITAFTSGIALKIQKRSK